jgi:hypothetical protein
MPTNPVTTGLREAADEDLEAALEQVLAPRLAELLRRRAPGHCARVTDIPPPLAVRLCHRVRAAVGNGVQVHVLGEPPAVPAEVGITSTKLIELRNPIGARQRPPLLVFVPPGTRTSAEDSFDIATFEEVSVGDVYADLAGRLRDELPAELRHGVDDVFGVLDEEKWDYADSAARARYLLTIRLNDFEPDVAGAAVFELGLVPDFELFTDLAQVRPRIALNLRQLAILTRAERPERQRVLELGLTDARFRARLAEFVARTGLEVPQTWTRRIVVDRENWNLAFHRWPLREDRTVEAIDITVGKLDLARAGDRPEHATNPELSAISGQLYLPVGRAAAQLAVPFDIRPDARRITGLSKFLVQLVSEESGPTGVVASVGVSRTAKTAYKAILRKLRSAHLDQGWHFIRVLPIDEDGLPMPVAQSPDGPDDANESDRFFVITDDEFDEPPPQGRVREAVSVTHALRRLEFEALGANRDWRAVHCQEVMWKTGHGGTLQATFGSHGRIDIPLASALVDLERRILADPGHLGHWRMSIRAGAVGAVTQDGPVPPDDAVEDFLQSRHALFTVIRGASDMVVQGHDLVELRTLAQSHAETYAEVLGRLLYRAERAAGDRTHEIISELSALLRIDSVTIEHTDTNGTQTELTLISPTHPLRLLWLVTWAQLGRHWLAEAAGGDEAVIGSAAASLLTMRPLGFPLVVPRTDGRLSMAADDLSVYWGVCLPADLGDPQELMGAVRMALGVPERRAAAAGAIAGRQLADRVERYLRLHPYVTTLVISAVNAGGGDQLADMLVELQRRPGLKEIGYDLRLFAANPNEPGNGDALEQLLRGEWSTAADAEAFHTPSASRVTPKLAVAVRPLTEFRSATSDHAAHITLLFDAFSGERFGATSAERRGLAPVHGLRQDVVVDYVEDEDVIAWHKHPCHGPSHPLPGAAELSDLLAKLPATISAASAAVTTGQAGTDLVPSITLSLGVDDSTLLHQAHRSSDWVITVDRTFGVEYFDSPDSPRRPDYVIDSDRDGGHGLGHHVLISSRSTDELRALLAPAAGQHGLAVDPRHVRTFFDQLRLLSGQLAFKLASVAATQRTEVLGLALARLYLDYQRALTNQILIPLDAHLELYREARRRADEIGESVVLRRTDLALFSLDARRRTITCRLVEVKCYGSLPDLAAYQQLKEQVAAQLDRSAEVLAENFDPTRTQPDRPDRVVKNAELADLLGFYLNRARRHGTMRPEAVAEARWLLERLDAGYRLQFTRTGLVFDLEGNGTTREAEGGVEFHRIGRDLIEELIEAIPTDPGDGTAESLGTVESTVPRTTDAAFSAPARAHDIPEEEPAAESEADDAEDWTMVPPSPTPLADEVSAQPPERPPAHAAPPDPGTPAAAAHTADAAPSGGGAPDLPEVYLGAAEATPQYGILGDVGGRLVALDLNETHTISLFGVQGGGKSYTIGSIIEAAALPAPPVNRLPNPLATIVFHYSSSLDYAPEFTSMVQANGDPEQVRQLRERYGGEPAGLTDMVMLVPQDQLAERRAEYPGVQVLPLKFGTAELRAQHWRFLMGAVGNQSTYYRQLQRIIKAHRHDLRLDVVRSAVEQSGLADRLKELALQRLELAAEYVDDDVQVKSLVRPGRMIIVDLRDEFIEKDEALGLFVVLMQLFADAHEGDTRFNKLVVFDEAHKYIDSPDLVSGLVESVREMRHKGMNVLVASQDPPSVPISLIELSDITILHKFTSPAWLKHLQKANASLTGLTAAKMARLTPGEAYIWSRKATDFAFMNGALKTNLRPRFTQHGGETKTAVD